jgi:hypothetical protein
MNNKYTIMTSTIFLEKIKKMENEIQFLKIEGILQWDKITKKISIIEKTYGILGKKFSKGIKFENFLRKGWTKKFNELKI